MYFLQPCLLALVSVADGFCWRLLCVEWGLMGAGIVVTAGVYVIGGNVVASVLTGAFLSSCSSAVGEKVVVEGKVGTIWPDVSEVEVGSGILTWM